MASLEEILDVNGVARIDKRIVLPLHLPQLLDVLEVFTPLVIHGFLHFAFVFNDIIVDYLEILLLYLILYNLLGSMKVNLPFSARIGHVLCCASSQSGFSWFLHYKIMNSFISFCSCGLLLSIIQ